MTRGKFVLITEDQVYISIEFNGDMYPSGHGIEVMNRLKKVHTPDDFISEVTGFNKENFQYKDKLIYTESLAWFKKFKDFRIDYFDHWFSDWLYFKNVSGKDWAFITRGGKERIVVDGEMAAFTFGHHPEREDLFDTVTNTF